MSPRRIAHRAGALAFAFALVMFAVTQGVAPAPVGTASADWSDECSFSDSLLGAAYNTLMGTDTGCRWIAGEETDIKNLTATDAYASALGVKDAADSYISHSANFQENTRTVAYSKAKITLINELNNESSVSVAQQEVNNTVADYYSRTEHENLKDWNAKITQLEYLSNTSLGMSVYAPNAGTSGRRWSGFDNFQNESYTLINGTTVTVKIFEAGGHTVSPVSVPANSYHGQIEARDPDDSSWTTVMSTYQYGTGYSDFLDDSGAGKTNLMAGWETQEQQVRQNMDPYVDEVYSQYAVGQIDSTDLAMNDPSVIAQEASTSLNSTGYYGHASIMLASLGASGNVNASHTIETGDGTVLNGTLYYTADDAPESGWATNQTYTISDYNGTYYMAVQRPDGSATVADLSDYGETFTISRATNVQTGESLNATQVNTYTYDSTNASALAEEIDRLRQLREEYQSQNASNGSGGFGIGTGDKMIIALAAIGLILAATRN